MTVRSVVLGSVLVSTVAYAADGEAWYPHIQGTWSPEARALIDTYNDDAEEPARVVDNPFVATLWAAVQGGRIIARGDRVVKFSMPDYFDDELRVLVRERRDAPAPLIVFSPGVFNGIRGYESVRALELFRQRGFHVLVVPQPMTREYLRRGPHFLPGHIEAEAAVLLRATQLFIDRVGPMNVTSVHLVGESYGALLSAAAAALDAESGAPLIDGTVTLFSPPVDMGQTLDRLDRILDDHGPNFINRCRRHLIGSALDFLTANTLADLRIGTQECAGPLAAFLGFHRGLVGLARNLLSRGLVDPALRSEIDSKETRYAFRFGTYLTKFAPVVREQVEGGSGDLRRWMRRAQYEGFNRFRVLTSADDFLNDPQQWRAIERTLGPRHVLMLPTGGHLGYLGSSWIQNFMNDAFDTPDVEVKYWRWPILNLNPISWIVRLFRSEDPDPESVDDLDLAHQELDY